MNQLNTPFGIVDARDEAVTLGEVRRVLERETALAVRLVRRARRASQSMPSSPATSSSQLSSSAWAHGSAEH
jgi:hypothetical protein